MIAQHGIEVYVHDNEAEDFTWVDLGSVPVHKKACVLTGAHCPAFEGIKRAGQGLYCSVQHGRDVESSSSGQASGFSALAAARYRLP